MMNELNLSKVNNKIFDSWNKLEQTGKRRFFSEDIELLAIMRKVYDRLCAKTSSLPWFEFGAMQIPTDYLQYIECFTSAKPTVLIECGTAGGSATRFYSEALRRIHGSDNFIVITIELDPLNDSTVQYLAKDKNIISLIGSDTDPEIYKRVLSLIPKDSKVMVMLDSDHSVEHVLVQLSMYPELVSKGSYCIVQDTYLGLYNSSDPTYYDYHGGPLGAVEAFLDCNHDFEVDLNSQRWMVTQHPYGWLKRTK